MTVALKGEDVAKKLGEVFPGAVVASDKVAIVVDSQSLYKVAEYLKNTAGFEFDYLANLAAVDYVDYFEVVYHLTSLKNNHSLVLKTRCYGREKLIVPSVYSLWRTADYQEREAFDLMGITFTGHPNLKRLFLWEGFEGHPLRRDYL
ncbi:MAG: NADH-quinone oxidoreductase subunit C [Chloroflexi bacterium]|nr:NADH-quinone oxidoreductase subunit C [Chloroflexota bacterium]MBM3183244.1 NADH-quinone oxidoreductase subunit C [Chloroflexota bacterium]MBM4451653.1 NADH-quinone oxidoreductase subunit C [Chloroflexota bacterium]MBM4454562.1 NADH-quinone oxidoreductase subunit C [Chloroflexota bacterium]